MAYRHDFWLETVNNWFFWGNKFDLDHFSDQGFSF